MMHISAHTIFVDQEHSLAQASHKATLRHHHRVVVLFQDLTGERPTFKFTQVAAARPQVLVGYFSEEAVPCHVDLSTGMFT